MKYKPYPAYKDSGVEWAHRTPSHWTVSPLMAIADERDRTNKGMQENNLLSLSYGEIVTKNINDNDGLLPESFETYQIIEADDIVWRLTDLQNDKRSLRTALATQRGIITSAYLATRIKAANARFVAYQLRSYDTTKVFYSMGGGLRQSMKYSDVKRLPMMLPTAAEQTAIATFLDRETAKLDTLIAKQQKLIELLQEKRQALISHAVTKGLNPDAPMKDSGVKWLGEVPEGWRVIPLKYVSRIGNGSTPNRDNLDYWANDGYPWLNSSVVNLSEVTQAEQFVTDLALQECHLPIIIPPAVLVGITGQGKTRGMATVLKFEATINQHVAYIKPADRDLSLGFLLRLMEMSYERLRMDSDWAGSTKGAITCEQLGNLSIVLPTLQEQIEIVDVLDHETAKLDALIEKSRRSIDLMREHRTALISAAVTGKIDVREAA